MIFRSGHRFSAYTDFEIKNPDNFLMRMNKARPSMNLEIEIINTKLVIIRRRYGLQVLGIDTKIKL